LEEEESSTRPVLEAAVKKLKNSPIIIIISRSASTSSLACVLKVRLLGDNYWQR
jgi:hypothetical protein